MPRFKVTLEYAGTRYSGWQKQKNARTVQGEVERAIAEATGQRTFEFQGSGRTDAGVHALHQVAHLEIGLRTPPETLRRQINDGLPADINLLRIEPAAPAVSCAARCRRPQLPVSDLPPPLRVRQAVCVVGEGLALGRRP